MAKQLHELTHEDMTSPRMLRARRARRAADGIQHLLRDFLPQERETRRRIEERLLQAFYGEGLALINVPPAYDALTETQIAQAMLESHPVAVRKTGEPVVDVGNTIFLRDVPIRHHEQ